jgi:hypothetical protein
LKSKGAELARTDQEEDNRRALTPADPRPGGEPYYIDSVCPGCGTELVLEDKQGSEDVSEEEVWHDAWTCPNKQCSKSEYVVLDAPEGFIQQLTDRASDGALEDGLIAFEELVEERWK